MKERQSQPAPVDDKSTVNRRTVLYGAAAGGLAVALVGCGSDEPAGDATSSPTPQEPAEASSEPQEQTSKPEDANVLTETSEVPVNGGVIIDDEVVVTQPSEGTFKAFSAICTHQGCVVSDVANGIISCPCHGSQYSATDGSVEAGPAPSPLPEVAIDVKAGEVVRA